MTTEAQVFSVPAASRSKNIRTTLRRMPVLPVLIILAFLMIAVFADFIVPHDPYQTNLAIRLSPPFWMEGGSLDYPLGTDAIGRDILSRILLGARVSLLVAIGAIVEGGMIGTLLGLISGYVGGWVDALIMRITDAMFAFPAILLALILAVIFGPSFWNVMIVLGLVLWARYARLVRGEVLSWKRRDFVDLAKVAGSPPLRILVIDILPNVVSPIIVLSTLQAGWAIVIEASLSFLGAGVPPPIPSWGFMVSRGRDFVTTAWWMSVMPGTA
ncbi:MAG: ABC transporter permease, partial [Chloroflexota bacterium]